MGRQVRENLRPPGTSQTRPEHPYLVERLHQVPEVGAFHHHAEHLHGTNQRGSQPYLKGDEGVRERFGGRERRGRKIERHRAEDGEKQNKRAVTEREREREREMAGGSEEGGSRGG